MYNKAFKKIEHYLYKYNFLDIYIDKLQSISSMSEYDQNYGKWIKNKSSSLEDQAIKNIDLERRIYKIKKWQKLISEILENYIKSNKLNYMFINLKYFDKANSNTIQEKLNLSLKEQKDVQIEILDHIFFLAIKNNMLKEGDI